MMCTCSREQFLFEELPELQDGILTREFSHSGLSAKTMEGEAKLDEGNIEEAESSLREALSLNYEEARALLGRLEYQRGNVEAALQVFEGINISAIIPRMRYSLAERVRHRRGKSRTESADSISLHAASLLLEAIFLKAKSLQELDRPKEAALECKSLLDTVESALPQGMPESILESKLQETVSKAVELLPELWKLAGLFQEAIAAYRRALLTHWNLESERCARIQKEFATFLLYWGVEASSPSLAFQVEGAFVPKNNIEEAILLLFILVRKSVLQKIAWDPSVMEHLIFALSVCGQSEVLAKQFEELLPATYNRADRWYNMALCYHGAKQNKIALNLLRKCLGYTERPDDLPALILAAKICMGDASLAMEGIDYAERAVKNANGEHDYMKGMAYQTLGIVLARQARLASTDSERTQLQNGALAAFQKSVSMEQDNAEFMFHLGLEYAEQRNLSVALRCAKKALDLSGGTSLRCWRLVALILSGQKCYSEAEMVVEAALEETGKWEQGELLRIKAKLQVAQGRTIHAVETYQLLLAFVQAQRKSFGVGSSIFKVNETVSEVGIWQDLAFLYTCLEKWHDAELCLEKAQALKPYSATWWHANGALHEAQGRTKAALAAYGNALAIDPDHVPSKILIGGLLKHNGRKSLPIAQSFIMDALQAEPTNHQAWYNLGVVHGMEGRAREAADSFQVAFVLEGSAPVENFNSVF